MLLSKVLTTGEYTCGSSNLIFSGTFPYMVSTIILIIKIAVPILLVIFGMIDLGKAVIAQKEDEIKKGQQTLIKRAIAAVIVFFVIQIVQIIVRFVSNNDVSVAQCFNCFIQGEAATNACESTVVE